MFQMPEVQDRARNHSRRGRQSSQNRQCTRCRVVCQPVCVYHVVGMVPGMGYGVATGMGVVPGMGVEGWYQPGCVPAWVRYRPGCGGTGLGVVPAWCGSTGLGVVYPPGCGTARW